jgi:hypothetical protein
VTNTANNSEAQKIETEGWVDIVRDQLRTLKFGVVQIIVHEGRVVQIERTEKLRLDKNQP